MAKFRDETRRATPRMKEAHRSGDEGACDFTSTQKSVSPGGKSSHEMGKRFGKRPKLSGDRWRNKGY